MNIIIFILGVLLIVAGIAIRIFDKNYYINDKKEYERKHYYDKEAEPYGEFEPGKSLPICLILGTVLIVFAFSFTIVPTGYTGVRTVFKQINKESATNGFNLKIPFIEKIEKVNNKQQDIVFEDKIWSETSSRTAIYYSNVTVTYQISKDKSAWIYANVSDYDENLVTQSLVGSAIKSSSKELIDTDATNRIKIEKLAMENIQKSLDEKYGGDTIIVNKVVIGNADFEDSYNKAISAKQKAQLTYEKQQIENKTNIEKAEAEAKAKIKTAEGNAKAKTINAQAEADANKLLEKSLTDKVLQSKMLDKWDGILPKITGNNNAMLDVGNILGE